MLERSIRMGSAPNDQGRLSGGQATQASAFDASQNDFSFRRLVMFSQEFQFASNRSIRMGSAPNDQGRLSGGQATQTR